MRYTYFFKLVFSILLFIVPYMFTNAQALKPGDVSPSAKYIDADVLQPFNLGAAIVVKGQMGIGATALINKDGDFIEPFNKYHIVEFTNSSVKKASGLFLINGSNLPLGTLLNSKGEIFSQKSVINDFTFCNCKLIPFLPNPHTYIKYGYKDNTGKIIVQPQYSVASNFSDGMALVGNGNNETGEINYGYIDSTGKLVIPLMYSRKPTDFYGETAIVYPKIGADFKWALINKKGEIIKKYEGNDPIFPDNPRVYFHNMRYNPESHYLLGYNGKILSEKDFLAFIGIKPSSQEFDNLLDIDREDGKIYYTRTFIKEHNSQQIVTGFVDIYTGKRMEGPFENGFYFDKISGLAHAKIILGKNKANYPIERDGYINEDGIFVIVKKEQSEF